MQKLSCLFVILLLCCSIAAPSFAANPLRLKYIHTIYDDYKGVGLLNPEGVACTDNYFVVADTGNNRLVQYRYKDKVVKPGEFEMPVPNPLEVQVNSKGEIFALDGRDRQIIVFNPDGTEKEYLAPKGSPFSKKMVPRSFKIDVEDRIYILDLFQDVVLVLDPAGKYIRHIPLPQQAGYISDLAVNRQGKIFVVDSSNPAVYSAADAVEQFSLLTKRLEEYANFPTNIGITENGIIYLVDRHGGNLVVVGPDGSFLGHKFGYGWRESQFYYPSQLCISEGGTFIIADRNNNRVQIFESEE